MAIASESRPTAKRDQMRHCSLDHREELRQIEGEGVLELHDDVERRVPTCQLESADNVRSSPAWYANAS